MISGPSARYTRKPGPTARHVTTLTPQCSIRSRLISTSPEQTNFKAISQLPRSKGALGVDKRPPFRPTNQKIKKKQTPLSPIFCHVLSRVVFTGHPESGEKY